MKKQKQKERIQIQIKPEQYGERNTRILGNHFIYGKLGQNDKWNDTRLKVLSPDYFIGKNILDIGCNQGILSIPIAIKYQPKMVHAIDIDPNMIKKVKNNIDIFKKKNENYRYPKQIIDDIRKLPQYFKERLSKRFGQRILELSENYEIRPQQIDHSRVFPNNIMCYTENILAPLETNTYDCILCMNITKWIHLAFGDDGIKLLFSNIQQMSEEGTILILQCQPWSSYRKKKNMYSLYSYNYKMILQKPDRFKDYLEELGFQLKQRVTPNEQNLLKHQILVFQKKDRNRAKSTNI